MKTYTICQNCDSVNRVDLEKAAVKAPVCGQCRQALEIHGPITETSAAGLNNLAAKSPLPVVVDFWAPWCAPCRSFTPTYQQVAGEMLNSFVFAKVNTEQFPLAADAFRIQSIPTLVILKGGLERDRVSGAMPPDMFRQWLGQHQHLAETTPS